VLLEAEWVLRSSFGWSREQRVQGLAGLLDLPHAVAFPTHARWALEQTARGADFADMMHIAVAEGASAFATFDKKMRGYAGPDSPVSIETLR